MRSPHRFAGVPAILLCVVVLAGCGYDDGDDLPAVVEAVTPAKADLVGACGGSTGLVDFPSHGCTYVVAGAADDVTAAVAALLTEEGFDVSCRGDESAVEIAGLRGDVRVSAEITATGSLTEDDGVVNVYGEGYESPRSRRIPRGSVALSLAASRQSDASVGFQRRWVAEGFACTGEVLQEQTLDGCVQAWNGAGNEANRRLVLRRMRVPVAYVLRRPGGPGVSRGCFFGVLAESGRYLILESSWENGSLTFEEPELGYSSQKGLDAPARVRRDGTLVLKRPSLNDRCATWWNAPAGWEMQRAAARRRLAGAVEALYAPGQNPRCTYTLQVDGTYLRTVAEFNRGDWTWTALSRFEAPHPFRPNGELAESGWMAVGP